MKKRLLILFSINWLFTLANQIVYHYKPGGDSARFLALARQYSEFDFFDMDTNAYGHWFYAAFLTLMGIFTSPSPYVVGFIQTLIFTLAAVLLVEELQIYLNKRLLGALVLLFLIPESQIYNGYVLTESFGYSFILLIYWVGIKILNKGFTWPSLLLLSFFMGCAILNRLESAICFIPIIFLIYPQIKSKLILSALTLLLFPSVFIAGNGFKNYRTFKDFKLTAYNGGDVIFSGNNENLDGSNHSFPRYKEIFIPKDELSDFNKLVALPSSSRWRAVDSFYIYLAARAWKKDPAAQLGVIPCKLAKNWLLPGDFDVYTQDTTKARGLLLSKILSKKYFNNNPLAPAKHIFYMSIHFAVLAIIIFGMLSIKRKSRFQLSILILLLFNLLFAIPFCGLPRWHASILPILVIAFAPDLLIDRLNLFADTVTKNWLALWQKATGLKVDAASGGNGGH